MDSKESNNSARASKEDIIVGLKELGLKKGDSVGVHSSLKSLGYVEGGADAVIDALFEVVGEQGTVVMPTYSTNRIEVERTPEQIAMGVPWLFKILPYDPKATPCWTGVIPETFRKRKGVLRSLHRMFSLAAKGSKAQEIIEAANTSGIEGWKKLLELEGYILLIGVGLDRCTAMHIAEQRVELPKSIKDKITAPKTFVEQYPEDEWEWDFGPYPDFNQMEEPCLQHKIMKTAQVGKATLKLVRLRDLIDLYVQYLEKWPDLFYH